MGMFELRTPQMDSVVYIVFKRGLYCNTLLSKESFDLQPISQKIVFLANIWLFRVSLTGGYLSLRNVTWMDFVSLVFFYLANISYP